MRKAELRKIYLEKRKQLSEHDFKHFNQQIAHRFGMLDLSEVKVLHIFLPIIERHEINTYLIIEWLEANHPKIQIVVPKSNFSALTLEHFIYNNAHLKIEKNNWNIPEPVSGDKVSPQEIDMVVVPLLAFDKKGYRIGYGKGFYDRFLAECRLDVQIVGLSQFEPIETMDDINEYDVPLQQCICPQSTYSFTPLSP
ncbi:5-formyltetrahydrofolate cyclo-ligase [Solitalea koreensis]|uniref:5-formyltetrahydrofolate cyclo-ligase n=1 Tax=Solitalea koreensis TaxID=543615 RepID=A0A521AZZ5_9SPHI|nr:5-formyltetrahydrofolate cyclo-ligase [Solitalea koreensis]SMO40407.1 5-formyltetrahydrofolate cyclo-ligase [Solitalea koreensis]